MPVATPSPFGALIAEKRNARGWSQPQLARLAAMSAGYVGGIESGLRGQRPSRDVVLRLARAFGEHPYELLEAAGRVQAGDDPAGKPSRPTFEQFVRSEPLLREVEKEMLIRLFRSYVQPPAPPTQSRSR